MFFVVDMKRFRSQQHIKDGYKYLESNLMRNLICALTLVSLVSTVTAQTREEIVRGDRKKVEAAGFWIYNNLPKAFAEAKRTGKPIVVVLRCLPCHECVKLDDELVDTHPEIRPLLEQFVCAGRFRRTGST